MLIYANMKPLSVNSRVLPQSARRLRDEPVDTATQIVEQFGERGPTSLGEAQVAAYFDGRLRRAGMKVSADGFLATAWNGWDCTALAAWVLGCGIVYRWQPLVGIVLAVVAVAFVLYEWLGAKPPLFAKRRPSQNVIGTRALAQRPRRRVVLVAPLDAPASAPPFLQTVFTGERTQLGRLVACGLVVLFGVVGIVVSDPTARIACWLGQLIPLAYLVVAAGVDWWLRSAQASPGAIHHAGALATLLACAEELTAAQHTELWAVALGASQSGEGLADLLRRYPFEPSNTSFIVLEGLGVGSLAFVTRAGLLRQIVSDEQLLAAATTADAGDPLINATPQPILYGPTVLERLRRNGWQAIGISSLDAEGKPPLRGSAADTPDKLKADVLDRAVRLVLGIVRQLDKE